MSTCTLSVAGCSSSTVVTRRLFKHAVPVPSFDVPRNGTETVVHNHDRQYNDENAVAHRWRDKAKQYRKQIAHIDKAIDV